MTSTKTEIMVSTIIDMEQGLEFDDEQGLTVCSYIFAGDEDDPYDVEVSFESLVDDAIELGKLSDDYQNLFCISHELTRHSEKIRDVASRIEDGYIAEDLFER